MLCKISIFILPVQVHGIGMENFWYLRGAYHLLNYLSCWIHQPFFGTADLQSCSQTKLTSYWNPKIKHYNFQQFDASRIQYFLQGPMNIFFEIPIDSAAFTNLNFASLNFIEVLQSIFPNNLWAYYVEKWFHYWIHHF